MISINKVTKIYDGKKALDNISFDVEEGKIIGLLGPNGAGKTTVIKFLATLIKADSGSATINGIDVASSPKEIRKMIGLAGQYAAVDEALNGRENLQMIAKLFHIPRKEVNSRVDEVLSKISLTGEADKPVRTYSGGMRKRLDLGASLLYRPKVMFLDEPTTGLDPRTRNDLWKMIRDFVKQGVTVILTTQYLEEADALASRIILLDKGRVVAEGTSAELKKSIGGEVVSISLNRSKDKLLVSKALTKKYRDILKFSKLTNTITIPVKNGQKELETILRSINKAGIDVNTINLKQPSLDEVFLKLTKGK